MNRTIQVKNKVIGSGYSTFIIAEMSANHAGEFDKAIELIHAAKEAGVDAIKVQLAKPEMLTLDSNKEYFKIKNGTWEGKTLFELYKETYTPWEWMEDLKKEAENNGLYFFGSVFGEKAVDFMEKLNVDFYKIASFEMSDLPLVKYIAETQKPIIMSTGLANLGEIEKAVKTVREVNNENLALLKCSSAYPAVPEDMNLKTIKNMKNTFQVPVGLSDHSLGSVSAVAAVAMGASIVEKHLCLSRDIDTPDSSFSMEPDEFKNMVEKIRTVEKAKGKISYGLSEREKKSKVFKRSIFVSEDIQKGEKLNKENIKIIRPGYGLKPKHYEEVIGRRASQDIEKGQPLDWGMVN